MGLFRFLFVVATVVGLTVPAFFSAALTSGQSATPTGTARFVCTPEPRLSSERLRELAVRPAPGEAPGPILYFGGDLPAGTPVDAETAAAIEAVVYRYLACDTTRDVAAAYALLADDTIRATLIDPWRGRGIDLTTASYPFFDGPGETLAEPFRDLSGVRVFDINRRPDGIVGALVDDPTLLPPKKNGKPRPTDGVPAYFQFVQQDGRWKMLNTYGGVITGPVAAAGATPIATP